MTAKEMFEELGHEKEESLNFIEYTKGKFRIEFNIRCKTVSSIFYGGTPHALSVKELKAINQQGKELGWYD